MCRMIKIKSSVASLNSTIGEPFGGFYQENTDSLDLRSQKLSFIIHGSFRNKVKLSSFKANIYQFDSVIKSHQGLYIEKILNSSAIAQRYIYGLKRCISCIILQY